MANTRLRVKHRVVSEMYAQKRHHVPIALITYQQYCGLKFLACWCCNVEYSSRKNILVKQCDDVVYQAIQHIIQHD